MAVGALVHYVPGAARGSHVQIAKYDDTYAQIALVSAGASVSPPSDGVLVWIKEVDLSAP